MLFKPLYKFQLKKGLTHRRTTKSIGKRFFRIVQQAVVSSPMSNKQVAMKIISPLLAN